MQSGILRLLVIALAAILFLVLPMVLYTVDQREQAIVIQFGKIQRTVSEPGLHAKLPWQSVQTFDKRVLGFDLDTQRYLTKEKKNLDVDSFVKWRIKNPEAYKTRMSGDENVARSRLSQIIRDGLRGEFGKRNIQEVVAEDRSEMMRIITEETTQDVAGFGIEVIDVRIRRIELPDDVSDSVYRRMEAERKRVAQELRARGQEAAERIRADADRQREVLLAEAYRDAEQIRGDGDALAADTYAKAYGKDEEFFAFYRSLDAYKTAFDNENVFVMQPDGPFFEYFNSPDGTQKAD
jgi:membrane protease subunit HflC